MAKKIKFGKISVTVFLTALIWVWADLAEDEQLPLSGVVRVSVSNPADPNLWVALESESGAPLRSLPFKSVVLKGPAWRIADVERRINKGQLPLELFVPPEQMALTGTETRTVPALSFLKQSKEIRHLGLTVESCEPNTFIVQARRLSIADVPVECVALSGAPLSGAQIDPPRVKMRVAPGEVAVARVRLTESEQKQACETPVEKTPYMDPAGIRRDALETVKVKLPPVEDALRQHGVSATLGICMSQNLQGKYDVQFLPKDPPISLVAIRATDAARKAYAEDQLFQIVLNIDDQDVKPGQEYITRAVEFKFPQEYVQRGEIKLDQTQEPIKLQFRLVPMTTPPTAPPSGTP